VVSLTNTPAIYITPRPRVLIRISRFAKGNADAMKDDADTIDSIDSFIHRGEWRHEFKCVMREVNSSFSARLHE
jgi:hypothetical protein